MDLGPKGAKVARDKGVTKKKSVYLTFSNKTISLGSFHEEEAKERLARGKKLTKEWRKTMNPKPTNEWVIQELERLGVRTVTGRGRWNKRRRGGVEESSVDVGGREDASSEEEVEEESDDNFSGGEEDSVAGRGANDSDYVESGNDDPSSPPKIVHRLLGSANGANKVSSKRKTSPNASSVEANNETHLCIRDPRYNETIMKYADILYCDTASDKKIMKEKISPLTNKAFNDLTSSGRSLVKPGNWGRWSNLSKEEFKGAALDKIMNDIRDEVLERRREASKASVGENNAHSYTSLAHSDYVYEFTPRPSKRKKRKKLVLVAVGKSTTNNNNNPKSSRALTGYNLFVKDFYEQRKSAGDGRLLFGGEIGASGKWVGPAWNNLSDEEKRVYKNQARELIETNEKADAETAEEEMEVEEGRKKGGERTNEKGGVMDTNDADDVETPEDEIEQEEGSKEGGEGLVDNESVEQQQQSPTRAHQGLNVVSPHQVGNLSRIKREEDTQSDIPHAGGPEDDLDVFGHDEALHAGDDSEAGNPVNPAADNNSMQGDNPTDSASENPHVVGLANADAENLQVNNDTNRTDEIPQVVSPPHAAAGSPAGGDQQADNTAPAATSFNPSQNTGASSSDSVGAEAHLPLYNTIRAKVAHPSSQYEKTFYVHLKNYMGRKSLQNKGRLLLSDINKIKRFVCAFREAMEDLDNKKNDYADICYHEGRVKGVIEKSQEELVISK